MSVNLYLAALYSRRPEMEQIAIKLMNEYGYDITSDWVFGGEEGLTNEQIALMDLEDLDKADTIVFFTQPYGSLFKGGGRCVEFGYAIAEGKRLVVIGERENVFTWYPDVEQYDTLEAFLKADND